MRLRKTRFHDDKAVDIIKSMQVLKLDAVTEICKNINLNINKTCKLNYGRSVFNGLSNYLSVLALFLVDVVSFKCCC